MMMISNTINKQQKINDLRQQTQLLLNDRTMGWARIYRKIEEREYEISKATCHHLTVILICLRI